MKSVLIANRGEIAVRIIRTAREAGLRTVAVYSEPDRDAYHAQLADQAWNIGPAPAGESYLNTERILGVAAETGAEAVHPGYGFLSENASFAQAVTDAGLIWVGPPPGAIAAMGDKVASRRIATEAGVPVVPGTESPLEDPDEIKAVADRLGYPVLIKASRAGGGRGMRTVSHRPSTHQDPIHQQLPTKRCQSCFRVSHEGLPDSRTSITHESNQGGPPLSKHQTVNHVPGKYS